MVRYVRQQQREFLLHTSCLSLSLTPIPLLLDCYYETNSMDNDDGQVLKKRPTAYVEGQQWYFPNFLYLLLVSVVAHETHTKEYAGQKHHHLVWQQSIYTEPQSRATAGVLSKHVHTVVVTIGAFLPDGRQDNATDCCRIARDIEWVFCRWPSRAECNQVWSASDWTPSNWRQTILMMGKGNRSKCKVQVSIHSHGWLSIYHLGQLRLISCTLWEWVIGE